MGKVVSSTGPTKTTYKTDWNNTTQGEINIGQIREDPKEEGWQTVTNKKGQGNNNSSNNVDKAIPDQSKGNKANKNITGKGANQTPKASLSSRTVVVLHNFTCQVESMEVAGPSNIYNFY